MGGCIIGSQRPANASACWWSSTLHWAGVLCLFRTCAHETGEWAPNQHLTTSVLHMNSRHCSLTPPHRPAGNLPWWVLPLVQGNTKFQQLESMEGKPTVPTEAISVSFATEPCEERTSPLLKLFRDCPSPRKTQTQLWYLLQESCYTHDFTEDMHLKILMSNLFPPKCSGLNNPLDRVHHFQRWILHPFKESL